MSEQRKSEGHLVTFENCTAASNIAAGAMLGISGTTIYSLTSATINTTATLGYSFIGINDDNISANQSPVTVWADGVFKLPLATASVSGNLYPGLPVWSDGSGAMITPGPEGDAAVGTLVGILGGTWGATGAGYVFVKIRPMAYNWTIAATAALSSTAPLPGAFPELAAR